MIEDQKNMVGVEISSAGSLAKCVHRIKSHDKHHTVVATVGVLKALMGVAVPKNG